MASRTQRGGRSGARPLSSAEAATLTSEAATTSTSQMLNEEKAGSPADWMAGPACRPLDCSCWKPWAGWMEERWTGS